MSVAQQPGKLGDFIRDRRNRLRLSRADLAELLTTNGYECTESAINHWESGRATPPLENPTFARALSTSLNIAPSELLKASGLAAAMTQDIAKEAVAKLSPDVLQLLKEASPQDIKKVEAIIRAALTEFE